MAILLIILTVMALGLYRITKPVPPGVGVVSPLYPVASEAVLFLAPQKFEAGVPVAAQAVGLAAACDYLTALGLDRVHVRFDQHLRAPVGDLLAFLSAALASSLRRDVHRLFAG